MTGPIGVGIIGANPGRGWAHMAHVPALQSLDRYRIVAVATRSIESATATAASLGCSLAFDDPQALACHPDVDLVVVTVKVPAHYDLVRIALDAGKHIFCEWPLASSTAQAEELLALAEKRGVRHAVGLQGRLSATVAHVRELVAQGYVGELLSCSVIGSGLAWGAAIDEANSYLLDVASGATMLTIPVGHFLDTAVSLLGPVEPVAALITQRRRTSMIVETGISAPMTAPDQIMVEATTGQGAPLSVHFRGGLSKATNLHRELNGTEGDLLLTAATGHVQMSALELRGARGTDESLSLLELPAHLQSPPEAGLTPMVQNVRRLYDLLASDVRDGTALAPDFEAGLANHRLIDRIRALAAKSAG